MRIKKIRGVLAVLFVIFVAGCEGESYSLSVKPETLHLTSIHDHPVLTAAIVDATGEEVAVNVVEWRSSDASVVEIDKDGRVSARGNGAATITGKTASSETEVPVTVNLALEE